MNKAIEALCALYGWKVQLYPPGFRTVFEDEIQADFAAAATDASSQGLVPLLVFWLHELRDWPEAVISAYGSWVRRTHRPINTEGDGTMGEAWYSSSGKRAWAIDGRGRAALAALPPLAIGLGVGPAATINGELWLDLKLWQQALIILLNVLPVGILGVGGLIALLRSIPEWSYAWAGGTLVAATVLLKIMAEEQAEVGLTLALVLAGGVVLVIAAWRGWPQAGLTGIGLVYIFGLSTFSLLRAAPFHRNDLVLLAAPLGLLQAVLTYVYVRGRRSETARWFYLGSIWLLNGAPIMLAHCVWQPWLAARGHTSPVLPRLVIVTILAWAGPVAGLMGQPVRRTLNRA